MLHTEDCFLCCLPIWNFIMYTYEHLVCGGKGQLYFHQLLSSNFCLCAHAWLQLAVGCVCAYKELLLNSQCTVKPVPFALMCNLFVHLPTILNLSTGKILLQIEIIDSALF